MPLAESFKLPIRVYIEDTDAGGIVYYANYLKFMERARTEYMRTLGISKNFFFEQPVMFVVHSLQIDYRQPALLDDELQVTASVVKAGRASILFEQKVFAGEKLLVAGTLKVACVDQQSLKPVGIPSGVRQALVQQKFCEHKKIGRTHSE